MSRPSLFVEEHFNTILHRLENLKPDAPRLWGKMDAAQMMAHLSIPLEVGLGKKELPMAFPWPLYPIIRWFILRKTSFKPGMPTVDTFVVADHRQFDAEKQRLILNLREAFHLGLQGPWKRHNIFGNLTPEQWGTLTYMHLDHHLRQFGG